MRTAVAFLSLFGCTTAFRAPHALPVHQARCSAAAPAVSMVAVPWRLAGAVGLASCTVAGANMAVQKVRRCARLPDVRRGNAPLTHCPHRSQEQGGRRCCPRPCGACWTERRASERRLARLQARGQVQDPGRLEAVHQVRPRRKPQNSLHQSMCTCHGHNYKSGPQIGRSDGRIWYYHTPTGKMQWATPEEWDKELVA